MPEAGVSIQKKRETEEIRLEYSRIFNEKPTVIAVAESR